MIFTYHKKEFPADNDAYNGFDRGWDPVHCELNGRPVGLTIVDTAVIVPCSKCFYHSF